MKRKMISLLCMCLMFTAMPIKVNAGETSEIYSVILPTMSEVELMIDPQGIQGVMAHNDSFDNMEQYAGKISCTDIAMVTNLSSVPIKVTATLRLTGDATGVTTREAVDSEGNNILLYAAPSATDTRGSEDNYIVSSTGVVLSEEESVLEFILPRAEYKTIQCEDGSLKKVLLDGETGHGMALSFGGYVNKEADWSAYVGDRASKTIGMQVVFNFTDKIEEEEVTGTQAYAMKEYAGDIIEVENGSEYIPSEADINVVLETIAVSENSVEERSLSDNNKTDDEASVSGNGISAAEDIVSDNSTNGGDNTVSSNEGNESSTTVSENNISDNTIVVTEGDVSENGAEMESAETEKSENQDEEQTVILENSTGKEEVHEQSEDYGIVPTDLEPEEEVVTTDTEENDSEKAMQNEESVEEEGQMPE